MDSTNNTLTMVPDISTYTEITDKWMLISSPWPVAIILSSYLIFVLKFGPSYMKDRRPYDLKYIIMLYDLGQVGLNLYLMSSLWLRWDIIGYLFEHTCHPKVHPFKELLFNMSWYYILSKYIDLIDTCFMVLRKQQSRVTFLHVYHHTTMVFYPWLFIAYATGEQVILPAYLNTCVHVVMYSYYFLSSLGPGVKKYLWWKVYLTKLQLGQFFVIIGFMGYLYLNNCAVCQFCNVIFIVNVGFHVILFLNFYRKTYLKQSSESTKSR